MESRSQSMLLKVSDVSSPKISDRDEAQPHKGRELPLDLLFGVVDHFQNQCRGRSLTSASKAGGVGGI